MKLEAASGRPTENPTPSQIHDLLASFKPGNRDDFAILGSDSQTYIQTAITSEGDFYVEYRDGSADRHLRAKRNLSLTEVERAFNAYAAGDPGFTSGVDWEPLPQRQPSCLGVASLMSLVAVLTVLAATWLSLP